MRKESRAKQLTAPPHNVAGRQGNRGTVKNERTEESPLINDNRSSAAESPDDGIGAARTDLIRHPGNSHHNRRRSPFIEKNPAPPPRPKKSFLKLKLLKNRHAVKMNHRQLGHQPRLPFRATMRTEISAGAIPGMRDACPRFSGRVLLNRSFASVRRPATAW